MWSVIRENKAFVRREEKKKRGKTTKRGKVVCAASVSDSSGRGEVRGNWLLITKNGDMEVCLQKYGTAR